MTVLERIFHAIDTQEGLWQKCKVTILAISSILGVATIAFMVAGAKELAMAAAGLAIVNIIALAIASQD